MAAVLTAALMLEYLGHPAEAGILERAVDEALAEGATTPDLGGALGTDAAGDWLADAVARMAGTESD
jgi:3-isopropylmalate dehydrogenase